MTPAAAGVSVVEGSWRQQCGKNDSVVVMARADVDGAELLLEGAGLVPGAGPWQAQPMEGAVSYPPRLPMVSLGGVFLSVGTVTEVDGGLRAAVQTDEGLRDLTIQAAYEAMPEGARCG